jgi:hypothetical protein
MSATAARDSQRAVGRSPERLTLAEHLALTGKFIALEIYTPENSAYRRIEAIGDSLEECARMLKSRGLEPAKFEFTRLAPPY